MSLIIYIEQIMNFSFSKASTKGKEAGQEKIVDLPVMTNVTLNSEKNYR